MGKQSFPGLSIVSEELDKSLEYLKAWLNSQKISAQKISGVILRLFENNEKERMLLNLPATLIGETSGWVYGQISDKFPKDVTLLDCIILTGINLAQNPAIESHPRWEQVVVKMADVKKMTKPGENLSAVCESILEITKEVIAVKPYSASSRTDIFVFCVKFDFEKELP